ncbi:hypothetical protein RM543_17895 [Roseicyclus sp. F158]|uniref:Uncharacterized protein n=1 Tax=Tropicimonas omnivorans TaxID=3075590 RepID=A0ABU3DLF1_9RHOB|nr:hypothetical protein [Roseicyclus sp. F158]MDT0684548.1 hypothetical protein [Roseicyclus sp. F158]
MFLKEQGDDHLAICAIELRDIDDAERLSLGSAKLHLSLTKLRSGPDVLPVLVIRVGGLCLDCSFALGIEAPADRIALRRVLETAEKLTSQATWPFVLHVVDSATGQIAALRMTSLSPRFWQETACAILASDNIDRARHDRLLTKAHGRFPSPQHIARRAAISEVAGMAPRGNWV